MKFIRRSEREKPKVSLVLLDWSVRESLHIFHYLSQQTVDRNEFEVVMVEYYGTISEHIRVFEEQVDTWVALDMPRDCYYHKHFMYNAGITLARGEIVMIGDSDAMVKPTFIETIIRNFEEDPAIVYHMDQFRNMKRSFYPFNYPSFEDVLGDGCINNVDGMTSGVLNTEDPIHARNYGACMCARREDLIAIGGADMHIHYLGHICGPYDMTFRLINHGRREVWETREFLYHTWHPGQAGADNYMGPHDGRHMSTTALEALATGRVAPLLESPAIRVLRDGGSRQAALDALLADHYLSDWNIEAIRRGDSHVQWDNYKLPLGIYKGFRIVHEVDRIFAYPLTDRDVETRSGQGHTTRFDGASEDAVRAAIDAATPASLAILSRVSAWGSLGRRALASLVSRAAALPVPVPKAVKVGLALPLAPFAVVAILLLWPRRARSKVRAVRDTLWADRDGSVHLATSLYHIGRFGTLQRQGILVLPSEGMRGYLAGLGLLRIIPRLRIEVAGSAEGFVALLRRLEQEGGDGHVFLTEDLHARYHGHIMASPVARNCLVL